MDCSPRDSSVHGILQARILEWVTISFSKGSSRPRDWTRISYISGRFFTIWATREALGWVKIQFQIKGEVIRMKKSHKWWSLPKKSLTNIKLYKMSVKSKLKWWLGTKESLNLLLRKLAMVLCISSFWFYRVANWTSKLLKFLSRNNIGNASGAERSDLIGIHLPQKCL